LRIVSGKYRGKHISPGPWFKARPTTDFAKESLFNILANHIDFEETEVLDLFSGTGSISYEFASRGCPKIEAVEINERYATFIKDTANKLEMPIRVYRASCYQFLKTCHRTYDLIFADPPYDLEGIDQIPGWVFSRELLKPGGMFILEHSAQHDFSSHPAYDRMKNYGSVHFSFFLSPSL
jgi:16S rRNA (guanine966-N2)-methyltransferase